MQYPRHETALLLVDPLNDFMSRLGKGWPLVSKVSKQVNLHEHLQLLSKKCRSMGWPVCYATHQRYHANCFSDRTYLHPSQALQKLSHMFSEGGFGGQFFPALSPHPEDIVASQHSCSSGFTGTDLHEKLQARNISHLVIAGFLSNTCIESTVRSALDLGYHVTLLRDAVAAWTPEDQRAAVEHSFPLIAHELTTTASFLATVEAAHD